MKLKNTLAVSCVTGFALLLCTAALAHKPTPEETKEMLANPWLVELITPDGQYGRWAGYPSKKACEAAIPQVSWQQSGHNGHCVYDDLSTGRIIGSQDPAWSLRDQWLLEFNAADGKYRRWALPGLGYPSKETCEAAINPIQLRAQGFHNGHCIELKDGHYVGSHDPTLAEK